MTTNKTNHPYYLNKADIARSFNRAVTSYDTAAILQRIVGDRLMERLDLVKIEPTKIVDLGSATGTYSRQLQKHYSSSKVIGVDLAWQMSVFAGKQRKWLGKERYLCADGESLPFADNSIQMVFSNLMFYWIEQPDRLFREIQRVLEPGGLLMFTSLGPDTLKEMRQSWQQIDHRIHVNRFMDMHDIGDSLTNSGFNGTVMDNETITMTYGSIADLHQDLRGLGEANINSGRNHGLTGKFLWNSYLQAYQKFRTHQGDFPASWEVIYGHGWASEKKASTITAGSGFSANITVTSPVKA